MAPQKAAKSSKVNLQFKGITNGNMTLKGKTPERGHGEGV